MIKYINKNNDRNINTEYFNLNNLTNNKTYIFGLIYFNLNKNNNNIEINYNLTNNYNDIIDELKNIFYELEISKEYNRLIINNNELITNITNISNNIYDFLENCKENIYGFILAYLETKGNLLLHNNNELNLKLNYNDYEIIKIIKNNINIPCIVFDDYILYKNSNSIDLLGLLYSNIGKIYNKIIYYKYLDIINDGIELPKIKVFKSYDDAILPSKSRNSDAGYDLTIIKEVKKLTNNTTLYDTGIKLLIPNGYYVEVFPRSSLSKSGYMLANSVGIIDQGYTGNILIALTKIDTNKDDFVMPFKCCQFILKKQVYTELIYCDDLNKLEKTDRNEGGYGSTDKL